jgi:hypothetical protein
MPTRDRVTEVHLHLSNAILSLADAVRSSGPSDRDGLAAVARLLTAAQKELTAVSKATRDTRD